MLKKLYEWLFHPEVRLNCTLPWSAKKIGKTYVVAFMYYFVGCMIPLAALIVTLWLGVQHAPLLVLSVIGTDGKACLPLVFGTTAASFVFGFGMELWYINSQMRRDGLRLTEVVGLNLKSLNGSPKTALKYALIALVIGLLAQSLLSLIPMREPSQAASSFAKGLHGWPLLGFCFLATVIAPIVEEIVFRGYAFNALRATFRNGVAFRKFFAGNSMFADWMAIAGSAVIFSGAHLEPSAFLHLFVLGVILAELYRRSGSLICPMILHSLNNLIAVALLIFQ